MRRCGRPAARTPAALREDAREAPERFGRMRQADSDLLVISPRIGIQSFGEREERLDAHGIVRTMRDAFTDLWIPGAQERHLLFTRAAFDDGRYRRARHRLHDRLGDLGLSHLG